MAPTLYIFHASPPVRAVLITAKAIGLTLNLKEVDFSCADLNAPQLQKLNPQHTVPTLVDTDGFAVWDSHAIITYLVSQYGKTDALYPKDLKKRALIDQRLHFESGVLFATLQRLVRPILHAGKTEITQDDAKGLLEVYGFVEAFLSGKKWMCGDSLSIADYSLIASMSSANVLVGIDPEKFPKISAWMKACEQLPEYAANDKGLDMFTAMIRNKLTNM